MTETAPEVIAPQAEASGASSFEELFRRFERPLLAFFSRRTSDGGTAENLLQETFFKAFRYWHTYDSSRRLSSWMFGIASNLYKDWCQEEPRRPTLAHSVPDRASESETTDPESLALAKGAREAAMVAVRSLPDKYRDVLLMKHYRRMTYREIADELGLQEGTVKSRLNTAAELLREKLRREGWLE